MIHRISIYSMDLSQSASWYVIPTRKPEMINESLWVNNTVLNAQTNIWAILAVNPEYTWEEVRIFWWNLAEQSGKSRKMIKKWRYIPWMSKTIWWSDSEKYLIGWSFIAIPSGYSSVPGAFLLGRTAFEQWHYREAILLLENIQQDTLEWEILGEYFLYLCFSYLKNRNFDKAKTNLFTMAARVKDNPKYLRLAHMYLGDTYRSVYNTSFTYKDAYEAISFYTLALREGDANETTLIQARLWLLYEDLSQRDIQAITTDFEAHTQEEREQLDDLRAELGRMQAATDTSAGPKERRILEKLIRWKENNIAQIPKLQSTLVDFMNQWSRWWYFDTLYDRNGELQFHDQLLWDLTFILWWLNESIRHSNWSQARIHINAAKKIVEKNWNHEQARQVCYVINKLPQTFPEDEEFFLHMLATSNDQDRWKCECYMGYYYRKRVHTVNDTNKPSWTGPEDLRQAKSYMHHGIFLRYMMLNRHFESVMASWFSMKHVQEYKPVISTLKVIEIDYQDIVHEIERAWDSADAIQFNQYDSNGINDVLTTIHELFVQLWEKWNEITKNNRSRSLRRKHNWMKKLKDDLRTNLELFKQKIEEFGPRDTSL